MKRKLLLALLVCSPLSATKSDYNSLLWVTSVVCTSGFLYTWLSKHTVQNELAAHKKRFKYQEFISDRYEAAFTALTNYQDYVAVIQEGYTNEDTAEVLSDVLIKQFGHDAHLLPTFLEQAILLRQKLEFKKKEIDNAFADWANNRKKILLNLQKPHIQQTFEDIITTLKLIEQQVPHAQASLFLQEASDSLKREYELYHTQEPLTTHVITSSAVGEPYPYRAYVAKLESYHDQAHALKTALDKQLLRPFQEGTAESLTEIYEMLDTLTKSIKTSTEYEAECAKYEVEQIAHAREQENQALKKQIAELKKQIQAQKPEPNKA